MKKEKTAERKEELARRRIRQRNAVPTVARVPEGKYIPAGKLKNLKPHNR